MNTYTVKFRHGDEAQVTAEHLDINTTGGVYLFSVNGKSVFIAQMPEVLYISNNEPPRSKDYQDNDVAVIKVASGINFVGIYKEEDRAFYSSDGDFASRIHRLDSPSVNAKITVVGNTKETL